MADRYSLTPPSRQEQEIENARTKGQVIGWVQGAGAVLVFGLVLNLIGWIPLLLLGGVAVYFVYKVLFGGKGS